ncbi:MAG: PAS domain-containing protein [Balneolaceae bacterium]|nr:PAS domain-containing protein [Balneolaceae bacterium]
MGKSPSNEADQVNSNQLVRPTPVNIESSFHYNELFFSVTDHQSAIQFANDVFLRVAKYAPDEILGQYHNLIRHPDMPKAAFKVMWDHLKANQSVAVYVKNLAKDGSYYWVTALVFPCKGGYLSIRLKPGSPIFEIVKDIYRKTLSYERELEQTLPREKVVQKSTEYMLQLLKDLGYDTYEQFMRFALLQEILNRDKHLPQKDRLKFQNHKKFSLESLEMVSLILSEFVTYTHQLHHIHTQLDQHSNLLLDLSKNIQAISQNARLQSSKLDRDNQSLFVVSETMGQQTKKGEKSLSDLISSLHNLHLIFSDLSFDIISSELQVEMTRKYLHELKNTHTVDSQLIDQKEAVQLLNNAFVPRLKRVYTAICKIPNKQVELLSKLQNIEQFLTVLRYIYITGKVEISRLSTSDLKFNDTFEQLRIEIDSAEKHLQTVRAMMSENTILFHKYESLNEQLISNYSSI